MLANPKRVSIPDMGAGEWPDAEMALVAVLDPILSALDPPGRAFVAMPENAADLVNEGVALVQVRRTGGPADGVHDEARMLVAVTTSQRSDSWRVLGWLRPQLHQFNGVVTLDDDTTAIIANISDSQGPSRGQDVLTDGPTVAGTFTVKTRMKR